MVFFLLKNLKTNRYILGLRSKGFVFCFGGEGRCGENRGRKWNSNCAGGHRTEKYWKVLPPTPDLLQTPNEGCPPALDFRVT